MTTEDLSQENGKKAAMYLRSAVVCQASIQDQEDAIREYAARHDIEIVDSYMDAGKAGDTTEGGKGLQKMLHDIKSGLVKFSVILLRDVTRWGRFQNVNESGYCEDLCRQAGVDVQYVEPPENHDKQPTALLLKRLLKKMVTLHD
jgi:DNA invertase Pin-like site-specific DNA recombinase